MKRTYSRHTIEAQKLLSGHLKIARITSGITAQNLAERAGISRDLLRRIENADPSCSIGVVFEVASLLNIPLFHHDTQTLKKNNGFISHQLDLSPQK